MLVSRFASTYRAPAALTRRAGLYLLGQSFSHDLQGDAQLREHAVGGAFFFGEQREQQMDGGDLPVALAASFVGRFGERIAEMWRPRQPANDPCIARTLFEHFIHFGLDQILGSAMR